MARNAIPAPIMHALAEATDKAFEWADNVAESGAQHPGRLAIAAEVADHLRGFGYEIQPITGEIPAPVCTDCGGPGGYHAAQCYEIERPRSAAASCSCGCPELPDAVHRDYPAPCYVADEVIEIPRGDGEPPYTMQVFR